MATRHQAHHAQGVTTTMTNLDMLAVIIALTTSITLVITTALANARLTRKVEYLQLQLNRKG